MTAIFQGCRYRLVSEHADTMCLEPFTSEGKRLEVAKDNRDLIVHPTAEDLHLAEAFERGEIGAFEYADGHTYPPNREIPRRTGLTRRITFGADLRPH